MVCPYSYVSNNYNFILLSKKRYTSLKYTKTVYRLVEALYRAGVISSFALYTTASNKVFIRITAFFYKNTPFFKRINIVSTLSKKFYISRLTLELTKSILRSSLVLLSTPKGIVTHKEALVVGTGGVLLYVIH